MVAVRDFNLRGPKIPPQSTSLLSFS
jgi:hypothetical protein